MTLPLFTIYSPFVRAFDVYLVQLEFSPVHLFDRSHGYQYSFR